jgi:hypothetical protein
VIDGEVRFTSLRSKPPIAREDLFTCHILACQTPIGTSSLEYARLLAKVMQEPRKRKGSIGKMDVNTRVLDPF